MKARFLGGPLDGAKMSIDRGGRYYVPLPPAPFSGKIASDDATPTITRVLCQVYERRGDCMVFVGEELR